MTEIMIGMATFISFQGILIIINENIAQQRGYLLSRKITKFKHPEKKKIGNKYSFEIERNIENNTIELNVLTREYNKEQNFEKQMKIGSFGVIYSE